MSVDVDVVMMSKASTPALAYMTQVAIDTARVGTPCELNVIVMEQTDHEYRDATTVFSPGAFNYNAFANGGAKLGNAPYIVVANNDVKFQQGWLDRMIAANWPVTSPVNLGWYRHRNVMGNECGVQVGRHLAGWCFMITRELWCELGGFDETYPFWCSDNAVMRQLVTKGIRPMLVSGAFVDHSVSATLLREPRDVQEDLTWGLVHQYNLDHDDEICCSDYRYNAWMRRNGIRRTL